jgi:hypothetical protein
VRARAVEEARCLVLGANAYVQKVLDFTVYFGSIQALVQYWLGAICAPSQGRGAREHTAGQPCSALLGGAWTSVVELVAASPLTSGAFPPWPFPPPAWRADALRRGSDNRGRLVTPLPTSVEGCYAYTSSSPPSQPPSVWVYSPVYHRRKSGSLHCHGGSLRRSGGRWPGRGGAAPRESGAAGVVQEVFTTKHPDSRRRL